MCQGPPHQAASTSFTPILGSKWPAPEGAPDGCYDVVTASGALEYADELHGVLVRVRSNLRPGGLAVVTLFNLAHTSRGAEGVGVDLVHAGLFALGRESAELELGEVALLAKGGVHGDGVFLKHAGDHLGAGRADALVAVGDLIVIRKSGHFHHGL